MPYKEGGGNQSQPYDATTGEYTKFKTFHKPQESKYKGKTFYHGSPNKYISNFDEKYAGSNVATDFQGIFFTDNKDVADDFSYQRLGTNTMFLNKKGEQGKVYEAELDMKNPLDLNNLTDEMKQDIKDKYLKDLGFGKEKSWEWFNDYLEANNIQGMKMYIDFEKLAKDGKYDSYIADLGGKYKGSNEYVIFKGNQAKLKNPSKEKQSKEEKDDLPF